MPSIVLHDKWIPAIIERTFPHYIKARRVKRGKPVNGQFMKLAYEDIRLAPRSVLVQELMRCSLEEELGLPVDGERI